MEFENIIIPEQYQVIIAWLASIGMIYFLCILIKTLFDTCLYIIDKIKQYKLKWKKGVKENG